MRKKQAIVRSLLILLSRLPLPLLHGIGVVLGVLVYLGAPHYRGRIQKNLTASGVCPAAPCHGLYLRVAAELGKGFMELPAIWFRPLPSVLRLVRGCEGWEHVEAAARQRRPVMLMSPHLGCFELVGLFAATRAPITSLYRPPRIAWLEDILLRGRQRSQARLVPANLSGVKALLAALRRGEIIGLLPDQAPAEGEGVWADFFGRPAYSPTLPARLAQTADVLPLLSSAERLPWGRGYRIRIEPLQPALPADRLRAVQALNRAMEALIRRYPTQYLWSYARHKGRGHARPTAAAE